MADEEPNILLLSVDSLRRDFCSFYNSTEETTPFLSKLSDESATFDRAIAPSTWTQQVHASIFTGLYPPEHQILGRDAVLGSHPTLAELLRNKGYEVKSFGHNGWLETADILRGFDHTHTRIPGQINRGLHEVRQGITSGSTEKILGGSRQAIESVPVKAKKAFFRHTLKGHRTVGNFSSAIETTEEPFCHFVHLNDAHATYHPSIKSYRKFGDVSLFTLLEMIKYQEELKNKRGQIRAGVSEVPDEKVVPLKDMYRACILEVDAMVERLISKLKSENVYENTVIIVFSDHGELFGKDGIGSILTVDEGVIRVPLLVRDPTETIDVGFQDQIVQLNDIYPTVTDLAGVEAPETNSIHLARDTRDAGFVYHQATDSMMESHLSEDGVTDDNLPPQLQYVIWKSAEQKLIWYPERDEYTGPASDDEELKTELLDHYESLSPIKAKKGMRVDREIEENLRQMGYL